MLQNLLKIYFNVQTPKQLYVEDIVWQNRVYPFYLIAENNFRFCMQNNLLSRQEILNFKKYLNRYIKLSSSYKYNGIEFENDAHEIYTKLKDTSISQRHMKKLANYFKPTIDMAYKNNLVNNNCKTYKHLRVVK